MIRLLVILKTGETLPYFQTEGLTLSETVDRVKTTYGGEHIKELRVRKHPDPAFVGLSIFPI